MICIRYPAAKTTLGALLAAGFIAGCQTTDPYTGENKTSSATYGALIGAGTGAAIGMISGKDAKQRKQRALVGAGVGALAGGAVGGYMDRQESELRAMMRDSGVTVTRRGDDIILNMPGNVTFRSGSADLNTQFFKVLDGVAALVDNGLVRQVEGADGEPRFKMLETIREYALERLSERGQLDDARNRHLSRYVQLAETAEPELTRTGQAAWLERLCAALARRARPFLATLTVEVDAREVRARFGIGLFRKSVPLADIRRCDVIRTRIWWGWGLHWTPSGWLYNVSGREAVRIELASERPLIIGSDEAPALKQAIDARRPAAGS